MPIVNRMAELHNEITEWRREIHQNPELMYDVHQTAATVAGKLEEFGCDEVVTGIGRTGVVGIIHGRTQDSGHCVGMRADMDALPITEIRDIPHKSKAEGKMHACGHDGHTAMLLGAAKYLAETRNFDGTVAVIFQPAEEGGAGGKAMCDDKMMERFGINEVYGMHNLPGLEVGEFAIRPGPIMAGTDEFVIKITGKGAHAAMPHLGMDPIFIGSQVVVGLQAIVSRNLSPLDSLVVTVTKFNAGTAMNVIPETVELAGTIRSLTRESRDFAISRLKEVTNGICSANSATASIEIKDGYPVTTNHDAETDKAVKVAELIAGQDNVDPKREPTMGGEDFSYMLLERPGAFIFVGNGDTAGLHHPEYDFNDEAIPFGTSYWAKLAETLMPAS
ncbi:MAG: M20 aminoacylase family protein [Pseudomonadota bacterium]